MGVRGLKTLIHRQRERLFCDYELHDTELVIDGMNLLHTLADNYAATIKLSPLGGNEDRIPKIYKDFFINYDEFATFCRDFFTYLLDCKITPIVVIDGGNYPNDMKLATNKERLNKRLNRVGNKEGGVLPCLANIVFLDVLRELNIPHMACIYEADREMAILAQKRNCPVLSNDSDFFVHDIKSGCIGASDFVSLVQSRLMAGRRSTSLIVKLYKRTTAIPVLFGMDPDDELIFPVFATLGGNDYFDNKDVNLVFSPTSKTVLRLPTRLLSIAEWINKARFGNGRNAFEVILEQLSGDKRQTFLLSVNSYVKTGDDFEQFDLESFIPREDVQDVTEEIEHIKTTDPEVGHFPPWFLEHLIKCKVNAHFMLSAAVNRRVFLYAQFEKILSASSYICSSEIRQVIYRIVMGLDGRKVVEYDRRSSDKRQVENTCSVHVPDIETIPSLAKEERKNVLFGVVSEMSTRHEEIETASGITLRMLIRWHSLSANNDTYLSALVICIIILHVFKPTGENLCIDILDAYSSMDDAAVNEFKRRFVRHFEIPYYLSRYDISMDVAHAVAKFQGCYRFTVYLNQLLLNPIGIPRPGSLINTALVCNICNLLENNVNPRNLLGPNSPLKDVYENWMRIIRRSWRH